MNIYQWQNPADPDLKLSDEEIELLNKVLDFPLFLESKHRICFKEIADEIELDLSEPGLPEEETLAPEQLQQLQNEVLRLNVVIHEREDWLKANGYYYNGVTFEYKKGKFASYDLAYHELVKRRDDIQNIIQKGRVQSLHLGSFKATERYRTGTTSMVHLYMNIISTLNNSDRTPSVITTFIHEMNHAWNYFACEKQERSVGEIDEAMVEFATLYFLKQISEKYQEFKPILNWAVQSVKEKQTSIGKTAAYGYGYYLYSGKQSSALNLLKSYDKKSGKISPALCEDVVEKLQPIYPFDEEEQVFKMFSKLLIHKYKTSGKNEEIRATLQEYFDSKKSELDKFSDLFEGHRVVVKIINGQIIVEVSQAIDTSNRGSAH